MTNTKPKKPTLTYIYNKINDLVKNNQKIFIISSIISIIIALITYIPSYYISLKYSNIKPENVDLNFLSNFIFEFTFTSIIAIIGGFININFVLNFFGIAFKLINNEKVSIKDLYEIRIVQTLLIFVFGILAAILLIIPYLLLVIPGLVLTIYFGIRFSFLFNLMSKKKDISIMESLQESWKLTKNRFWELLTFGLIFFLISFLISILFNWIPVIGNILGIILSAIFTIFLSIAWTYVYNYYDQLGYDDEENFSDDENTENEEKTEKIVDVESKKVKN